MMEAVHVYRTTFKPSQQLDRPYVMLGFNVFAAESDAEGALLATSMQQSVVGLRTGRPTPLPPPIEGYGETLAPHERSMIGNFLTAAAIGSPETVKAGIEEFVTRTGADELMITSQIFDHGKRLRSYGITAGLFEA
jgi:alkanesulfonate monooxygenase SsuD/methylene tetrahydromethanopterin reductase-like flavin-dependent oxidoreductase (luciferase family)